MSSSAASYRTAPLGNSASSFISSHSSSNTTSASPHQRDSTGSPIYALTQEIHIVKVTNDMVQIEPGTDWVNKRAVYQPEDGIPVGPPPPSPPASVERREEDYIPPKMEHPVHSESSPSIERRVEDYIPPPPKMEHPVHSEPSASVEHDDRPISTSTMASLQFTRTLSPTQEPSTDTNTSQRTPRTTSSPPSAFPQASSSKITAHLSVDGHLQPPSPTTIQRPTRRNTTGSTSNNTQKRSPSHAKGASQPFGAVDDAVLGEGGIELASDIEIHAEKIRRQRMSKRAKQQQEAEAALTRAAIDVKEVLQDTPLVGNLIGEGHVNYVLMYNMLTGIRIGVSRCQAKIKRPLSDEDFTARHKFSFDIVGNELTPSAKYDFKFKDYAPWVFRYLREDSFQLDPADYLLSLTAKYILSELGSPGKSGSFFYFSRDYRFIIKTIRHSEHKFLLSILKQYYAHVQENPHTLLSRFYGLHRVKLPHGRKIHFVIMNNLFPPHKDVHETYDLKGSTVGREYPEDKAVLNPRAVLKDLNWINRGKMLELGPEKRALLTEQLRRDAEFLKTVYVMDYSLLVGIHNMQRGNKDNLRKNTLKVFSPVLPETRRSKLSQAGSKSPEAIAMRRAMRSSDPKRLGKNTIRLPEEDTGDRQQFVFYQDEGGLRATDDNNEPLDTIYYLGIIDILTPYSWVKKVEHCWKGMKADRHKISPVPPAEYADRFFNFMKAIMRGGVGGEKFKEGSGGGEKFKEGSGGGEKPKQE